MTVALDTYVGVVRPQSLPEGRIGGLYVHIPFCFHKCHYCDFYSITGQSDSRMARFVDLALREAEIWGSYGDFRPTTAFFGGGTPSLLPLTEMRRLIAGLRERVDFSRIEEWTVEANPATVSLEYCQMLREMGIGRLSFGAQSFDRDQLKTLERHHDPDDVPRSVEIARRAGFTRLNVDLIYAIPGQDLPSWGESLDAAVALGTEHLSCYGLTYEPNTPMAVKKRLGQIRAVDEEAELEMLRHTRRRLEQAGRPAYEISNYAAPGAECRHNLVYWTGGNYIALGPSGASHIEGWRWKNRPQLGEWERSIESGELPAIDVEHLDQRRRAGELAMLMLRLSRGLTFDEFADRSGFDARAIFSEQIARLGQLGLIEADQGGLRLSQSGLAVADAVAAEFLDLPA
jgi:oxygen-independent coproporphyrinogen-3 oxidase